MKTKHLYLVLALAVSVGLTACGGGNGSNSVSGDNEGIFAKSTPFEPFIKASEEAAKIYEYLDKNRQLSAKEGWKKLEEVSEITKKAYNEVVDKTITTEIVGEVPITLLTPFKMTIKGNDFPLVAQIEKTGKVYIENLGVVGYDDDTPISEFKNVKGMNQDGNSYIRCYLPDFMSIEKGIVIDYDFGQINKLVIMPTESEEYKAAHNAIKNRKKQIGM